DYYCQNWTTGIDVF
nr:immunoglobulin light chain junction region [Macaca mulatta]MOY17339.1 immunoglobulin light chain junction region [Macaca mulatta]